MSLPLSQVLDINSVLASREHSIVAHRRLGARAETLQVLGRGNTLALSEILQENVDVALEAGNVLSVGGQEREDGHLAVRAFEQVPLGASERDAGREGNGLAVGAPCTEE